MAFINIPLDLNPFENKPEEAQILTDTLALRKEAAALFDKKRYLDAMERTFAALRKLREFPEFNNIEFRATLASILFDLAEIHFTIKNYRQSDRDLNILFKVLDNLVQIDEERFGAIHFLAMELSTRLLRSRKKAYALLLKHRISIDSLYSKVDSGMAAAIDKFVDSLRNIAQLLAATGDLKESLKFYAEAIKYSKKRSGRVTDKELRMSVEMAEIMIRLRHMRPRAKRLLETVLPHATALKETEQEHNILALLEVIANDTTPDSAWRTFIMKIQNAAKSKFSKKS